MATRLLIVCVLISWSPAARAQENPATAALDPLEFTEAVASDVPITPAAQPAEAAAAGPAAPDDPKNTVPLPEHTGFTTLGRDLINDFKEFPRRKSTWVILGIGGGLAALAHPIDPDVNARLVGQSGAEKFWTPGHIIGGPIFWGVPVALYVGGRYLVPKADDDSSRTNKWSHLGLDLLRAGILQEVMVWGVKAGVRRTRPNGEMYSFPSGHAAATFALAAVVERHLGYRLALPTIAIATYVATSRLHDNVHYLSDVIFGAAVGTAAGWTVVGRHGRTNYTFAPAPIPGGFAFMVSRNPRNPGRS